MTTPPNIPVFKPHMNKARILPELEKILDSGWIGLGPKTKEFEDRFASWVGTKYAVAVNSCTAALHLAILVAGVGEGDEVLVPTLTFASTALVLLYEKAIPVFVDCDPRTLCVNVEDLERKITPKTKAIMPVHFGGHAAPLDELLALSRKHHIPLIEDCAHAAGGRYKNKALGSFGALGCFSFHAVKNLPTADGGMIVTDNPEYDRLLRRLRWLGIDKDTWTRSDARYSWRYSIAELGYKYHMNDITAVIGLAQLETLDHDNRLRAQLAQRYQQLLKAIPWLQCPVEQDDVRSAWHNFVVQIEEGVSRDDLAAYLASEGISTGVHYEPIHHHGVFQGRSRMEHLETAERIWPRLLTLPLYPALTFQDQDRIVASLAKFDSRLVS